MSETSSPGRQSERQRRLRAAVQCGAVGSGGGGSSSSSSSSSSGMEKERRRGEEKV
ncbi:hypothetical protein ASPZODRAFT_132244 [Penicilliopsis zonata CBS 506.65]|uniref:Uncharacterized protein n=1 Tax=Penicilliopsis zonata CBS 506.65 TaxID=1073090 RepID=A0A1L9SJ52_9EURO|nr:hypothetical protein ASPZODRAFT_132244 [Penicilliopsis zonata CBS 506.65]OJJ47262.1 hypothetical protein ASPZODRAFT_132244 [Penicilliopsis zonata CBS 506.65]